MCGIAGFLTKKYDAKQLKKMTDVLQHRGPDAAGHFFEEDIGLGLGHRRLSILDLSDLANQPFDSKCGRYVMVFNGEVYNYKSIAAELKKETSFTPTTTSDTEVILAAFAFWGTAFIEKLNGMFAIAIWDTHSGELFLARDRLGKKPLYYYESGSQFAFASELKALKVLPFIPREIRPDAIKDFFAYQYIPDPKTIYRNVHKLSPGHWLKTGVKATQIEKYWDVSFRSPSTASESSLTSFSSWRLERPRTLPPSKILPSVTVSKTW